MADNFAEILYYVILIFFILSAFSFGSKKKLFREFKNLLIWLGIFITIFVGYSYRDILSNNRFIANLKPDHGVVEGQKISYFRAENGHFYINLLLNNHPVRFLVDTGATDIVINKKIAQEIGINLNDLTYDKIYSSANGMVRGATVRLARIKIKDIEFNNIYVSVNQGEMKGALLGMSFLSLFDKYEFEHDKLTLYK